MSFNLLDTAKGLFTNELLGKASAYLGEKESGIAKAISGILPGILGFFAEKTSTTNGANELATMINHQTDSGSHLNLNAFFSNDGGNMLNKGASMANQLFGGKLHPLIDNISSYAGIKQSSTSSLLSMAIPAMLGLVGKLGVQQHKGNLSAVFEGQKNNIMDGIPAGLSLNSLFSGFGTKVSDVTRGGISQYQKKQEKEKSAMNWLLPLLLLVLIAVALWYFVGKGCNNDMNKTNANDSMHMNTDPKTPVMDMGKIDSLSGDWVYNEGDTVTIVLPNNAGNLTVGKYSTEAKLVEFLMDNDAELDTVNGNWFEFTNVHFKSGSAEITDGSKLQLLNMATICKAFSNAQFKLGGYTDSTGSMETNIAVSQKRADAVMEFLKKAGVAATSFTSSKGYGPAWPITTNATPDGRARNRRVAVNVKAK